MKRLFAFVLALALTGGVSFAASDQQPGSESSTQGESVQKQDGATSGKSGATHKEHKKKTITDTVQQFSEDQKKLTVTGPNGNEMVYILNDNTKITTATGKSMMVSDLKPGTSVKITYTGTRENPKVTKVVVEQQQQQK